MTRQREQRASIQAATMSINRRAGLDPPFVGILKATRIVASCRRLLVYRSRKPLPSQSLKAGQDPPYGSLGTR